METRQRMFFSDFPSHVVGKFFSLLVPSPRGPRQAGQFSASTTGVKGNKQATVTSDAITLDIVRL